MKVLKNKSLLTLLCAAFFVGCSSSGKLSANKQKQWYMAIEKTACFGFCPMYKMEIYGSGPVTISAKRFLEKTGDYSYTLPNDTLTSIIKDANKLDWNSFKSEYVTQYSDLPSTIIIFSQRVGDTTSVQFESGHGPENLMSIANRLDNLRKGWIKNETKNQ